jgi:hypothetical protein
VEELGVGGENNIKIDLKELGLEAADWIHLSEDRD